MRTKGKLYLLAITAAALSLNISITSGQVFESVDPLNNRAVAASPRAKEVFPWLTRSTAPAAIPPRAADSKTALIAVRKNRALAASPRTLEQFPEFTRLEQPLRKASDSSLAATVIENRALASSPRAREEFPWLARSVFKASEERFEIAPLK